MYATTQKIASKKSCGKLHATQQQHRQQQHRHDDEREIKKRALMKIHHTLTIVNTLFMIGAVHRRTFFYFFIFFFFSMLPLCRFYCLLIACYTFMLCSGVDFMISCHHRVNEEDALIINVHIGRKIKTMTPLALF